MPLAGSSAVSAAVSWSEAAAQPLVPAPRDAATGRRAAHAIHLVGSLYAVLGAHLSHPLDANAYLLHGDEPVLFDAGSPYGYDRLAENLATLGLGIGDLRAVYATHGHYDHVGSAEQLDRDGVPTHVHPADLDAVRRGDSDRTAAFLYGRPFPAAARARPLPGGPLRVGRHTIEVLETPGHSPGSVSYLLELEGQRILIAGDAVWGWYSRRMASDFAAWQRSLDLLVAAGADLVCTAHGDPWPAWDATAKLRDARTRFAAVLDPWAAAPAADLRYR